MYQNDDNSLVWQESMTFFFSLCITSISSHEDEIGNCRSEEFTANTTTNVHNLEREREREREVKYISCSRMSPDASVVTSSSPHFHFTGIPK